MNSGPDTFMRPFVAERAVAGPSEYKWSKVGFPIRKSSDQSSFAAPQGLSQRTTSFIASQRQGIHRTPLRHLITLMIDVRRSDERQPSTERPLLVAAFRPPEHMLANQARDRDRAVAPPLVSRGCESPLLEPGSSSRCKKASTAVGSRLLFDLRYSGKPKGAREKETKTAASR
jgi:hypothetical protein